MLALKTCQSLDELNNHEWSRLIDSTLGEGVHAGRAKTFCFAREALRLALCEFGIILPITGLVLPSYDEVSGAPDLTLSLSHTEGVGVALVGHRKDFHSLGVDVEREDRSVKEGVLSRLSHPQDESLRNIELWVLKEAAFKCLMNTRKFSEVVRFIDIQVTRSSWSHSPSGLSGTLELRRESPYLVGLALLQS